MVKVKIIRGKAGEICCFEVQGHASFAEHGQDIVCAGVSAVAQTAVLGLEKYLAEPPRVEVQEGYLKCTLPVSLSPKDDEQAEIILQTMALGIQSIAQGYKTYVQLIWQ